MLSRSRPVRVAALAIGIVVVAAGSIAVVRDFGQGGLGRNVATPWWLDYAGGDSPADPSESKSPSIHLLVGPADEDEPLPTPTIPPAPPGSAAPGSDGAAPVGSTPGGAAPGGSTPGGSKPGGSTPGQKPGGSTPGGASPGRPAPVVPPPAAPAPSIGQPAFAAVAGEQCPQDASRGYQRVDGNRGGGGGGDDGRGGRSRSGGRDGGRDGGSDGGRHRDNGGRYGNDGRGTPRATSYFRNSGGWTGNGCAGAFQAVPMTGESRSSAYSLWWFRTGAVKQGNCAISVFVPKAQAAGDVTARPASYAVLTGSRLTNTGSFAIDQVANQGRWVGAGSRPVRDGVVAVQLLNRGGNRGGHAGSAQVKVACRAS